MKNWHWFFCLCLIVVFVSAFLVLLVPSVCFGYADDLFPVEDWTEFVYGYMDLFHHAYIYWWPDAGFYQDGPDEPGYLGWASYLDSLRFNIIDVSLYPAQAYYFKVCLDYDDTDYQVWETLPLRFRLTLDEGDYDEGYAVGTYDFFIPDVCPQPFPSGEVMHLEFRIDRMGDLEFLVNGNHIANVSAYYYDSEFSERHGPMFGFFRQSYWDYNPPSLSSKTVAPDDIRCYIYGLAFWYDQVMPGYIQYFDAPSIDVSPLAQSIAELRARVAGKFGDVDELLSTVIGLWSMNPDYEVQDISIDFSNSSLPITGSYTLINATFLYSFLSGVRGILTVGAYVFLLIYVFRRLSGIWNA